MSRLKRTIVVSLEKAKRAISEHVDEKHRAEASTTVGKLWAELIVGTFIRLGWTNQRIANTIGVKPTAVSQWRNAVYEPEPHNRKKLADFWESELRKVRNIVETSPKQATKARNIG